MDCRRFVFSFLVLVSLFGPSCCDRFHNLQNARPETDPIDPTGGNSPGIVIVYKKAERNNDRDRPQSPKNYLPAPYEDARDQHASFAFPPRHQTAHSDQSGRYIPPASHFDHRNRHPASPKCASPDDVFCLYDRDYPMEKVKHIADHYESKLSSLYGELNHYTMQEYMTHDNSTHNYRNKGQFICESDVSYVRPGWAKNWKGEWVAVLNTDVFPQSVRIETCKYPKKKCEWLPPCYKSYCVQRYTYVKLITVDPENPDKKPTVDVFEIPSACSCFVENFALYK